MSHIHFFTDLDLLIQQNQSQAYGFNGSDFLSTSLHTASGTLNAYAICDGMILVQEMESNPGLLNLILKPRYQSVLEFDTIQYIIYRGIIKSSIINGDEIAEDINNDYTNMMWSYQELLNQENGTNDTPPSKICGIKCTSSAQPPNQFINSDELDAIFYDDESDFEPFMVNAGSSIGSFNVGEFGVDIFLGGLAFKPTFEMARGSKNTLQIDLSTNTSPASKLSKTYSNQRIFNFIDPCAFYGLFFHNGVEVKFQPTDTSFQLLKESGLYESLLEKFFNKDVAYVDLRNEHNYAFDLYQNFSDPINITVDDGNVTSYPYGDPLPMISLHSSNFSENGSSGKIIFNLPKGDHFYSKVFLGQGFYQEYYPEVKKKLKDIEFFGDYSEDIEISIPKNSAGDIIPCHINLRYIKKVVDPPPVQAPLTIEAHYYLDNLFDLKRLLNEDGSLSIPPSISGNCKWNILHDDVFVDESSGHSEGYMAKVGIAEDNNSIYLFRAPSKTFQNFTKC